MPASCFYIKLNLRGHNHFFTFHAMQFEGILNQRDPTKDLCNLVDPRLGDNYPIDSVLKVCMFGVVILWSSREIH